MPGHTWRYACVASLQYCTWRFKGEFSKDFFQISKCFQQDAFRSINFSLWIQSLLFHHPQHSCFLFWRWSFGLWCLGIQSPDCSSGFIITAPFTVTQPLRSVCGPSLSKLHDTRQRLALNTTRGLTGLDGIYVVLTSAADSDFDLVGCHL